MNHKMQHNGIRNHHHDQLVKHWGQDGTGQGGNKWSVVKGHEFHKEYVKRNGWSGLDWTIYIMRIPFHPLGELILSIWTDIVPLMLADFFGSGDSCGMSSRLRKLTETNEESFGLTSSRFPLFSSQSLILIKWYQEWKLKQGLCHHQYFQWVFITAAAADAFFRFLILFHAIRWFCSEMHS